MTGVCGRQVEDSAILALTWVEQNHRRLGPKAERVLDCSQELFVEVCVGDAPAEGGRRLAGGGHHGVPGAPPAGRLPRHGRRLTLKGCGDLAAILYDLSIFRDSYERVRHCKLNRQPLGTGLGLSLLLISICRPPQKLSMAETVDEAALAVQLMHAVCPGVVLKHLQTCFRPHSSSPIWAACDLSATRSLRQSSMAAFCPVVKLLSLASITLRTSTGATSPKSGTRVLCIKARTSSGSISSRATVFSSGRTRSCRTGWPSCPPLSGARVSSNLRKAALKALTSLCSRWLKTWSSS